VARAGDKPTTNSLFDLPTSAEPPTPEQSAELADMVRRFFVGHDWFAEQRQRSQRLAKLAISAVRRQADKSAKPKGGRKFRAVLGALPKLYPPAGKVPDSVSTKTVQQEIIVELGYDVHWSTVNRALGREE
jgi:hypothetical protein